MLKKLALSLEINYKGEISVIFKKHRRHDENAVNDILDELDKLPGVSLKIATLYFKFMVSTFKIWKWKNPKSLVGVAMPNDFQVRKVFIRLGHIKTSKMEEQYSMFSHKLNLPFMDIDDVLWNSGRIFCSKSSPACYYCPFLSECIYAKIRKSGNIKMMKKIDLMID